MDDQLPPEDDPMLADVWPEMSDEERELYRRYASEPVPPEVTERVQRMFEERFPKP